MKSNYKRLGKYIQPVNIRNTQLNVERLLGVSIQKILMPSIANTVGTNMKTYKIIKRNQFAYGPVTSRNGNKISVALLQDYDKVIVSQAYTVFEVKNENELHPEYLMMWFRRPEFDRYARFKSHGSAREVFDWEEMCEVELPIPTIEKQYEIVKEYNTIVNRIKLNEQLNQKLEETAQALYKHWFVDFEFPNKNGLPYKSNGGKIIFNVELEKEIPAGWENGQFIDHARIEMGQSPKGDTYNINGRGMPLVNGPVEFGEYFTKRSKWTTSPTKTSKIGDLIVCVRGSTTGRYVKSNGVYCLGRGVCSMRGIVSQRFVDELYKWSYPTLLSLTTGSTFPNWDKLTLSSFPSIIPPAIVIEGFEKFASRLYQFIEEKSREIIALEELRNLILIKMTKVETEKEVVKFSRY